MQRLVFAFFGIIYLSKSFGLYANLVRPYPDLKEEETLQANNKNLIDPKVNYSKIMARITDRAKGAKILKLKVEVNNTKFFKPGDPITFFVQNHQTDDPCLARVKSVENLYFTIFVQDINQCWPKGKYFPRGLTLNISAPILEQRVFEASRFREILLKKRQDFLKQLASINNFAWTFDQQKIHVAKEYDEKILKIQEAKRQALDDLLKKKREQQELRLSLQQELNQLDKSLDFYRIERGQYIKDRWNLDHDMGVQFSKRPPPIK